MDVSTHGRARRIRPVPEIDSANGPAPDYASSFAAGLVAADARSAEEWARSILEGAPRGLRWFVFLGWRLVLRLRLAPRDAPGTVAGWTIRGTTPGSITLEVDSGLLTARKVLVLDAGRVILTTYVWFAGTRGRVLWTTLAPVHHRIEPLLITLAASRAGTPR